MERHRECDSSIIFLGITFIILSSIVTNIPVTNADGFNHYETEKDSFPCNYFDTINITDGTRNTDNSITYDGVTYPEQHYKMYNYAYRTRHERIRVPQHIRGCVCFFKKCVRLCCDRHQYLYEYNVTDRCQYDKDFVNFELNVFKDDGTENYTEYDMFVDNHYPIVAVYGQPCGGYFLKPEEYSDESWIVLEDGRLSENYEDIPKYHDRDGYCIAYVYHNSTLGNMLRAFKCDELTHSKISAGYQVGMLISIPFLLATLLVYAWIRELRATLHGKSLMCYIGGLTIGYTFLTIVQLNGTKLIDLALCNTMAFAIHGSLLAAFFWLNVISFDIWWTIGKPGDHNAKRFLYYSLYAFGTPFVILVISVIVDHIESIPIDYRPGFALKTCWIRQNKTSEFIYWYSIVLTIITLNTIFFGLTANNIRIVQAQSAKTLSRGDSRKHAKMQSEKDKFGLYLRLFIIMGVTWSMEVLSWWFETSSWIFYVTDACNLLQGPLIFLLFVWKPRVRALIRKRYRVWRGLETETNAMSRTSTSHISMERTTMIVKHDDNGKSSNFN